MGGALAPSTGACGKRRGSVESREQCGQVLKRHDLAVPPRPPVLSSMDHGLGANSREQLRDAVERREMTPTDPRPGLGLDHTDAVAVLVEQVAFQPVRVPEKREIRPATGVEAVFEGLDHDGVFEERPPGRVRRHLAGVLDAEKVAGQSHVVEVELGRFDEALADVGEKGRQPKNDVARLEDGEPVARRSLRHSGIRAQRTEVGELAHPRRAETHEPAEGGQIADLADSPNVAFDVGLQVVPERLRGIQPAIVNPRIESRMEDVVQRFARSGAPPFGEGERQEPQQRRSAGERLADGLGEAKLFAPGEDEEAGSTVFVARTFR